MKNKTVTRNALKSSVGAKHTRAGLTHPKKAAIRVKSVAKDTNEVSTSVDIENIIQAEVAKKFAPVSRGRPGAVKGKSDRPASRTVPPCKIAAEASKGLKRKLLNPQVNIDIVENLVRAQMSMARKGCVANTSLPAKKNQSNDGMLAAPSSSESPKASVGSDDVAEAVARINDLRRDQFASAVDWAFAILGQPARDVPSIQRAYRNFMRRLHPDKAGIHPTVEAAVDLLREATSISEQALSKQRTPSRPTQLRFTSVCADEGKRRVRVVWTAPKASESVPIHKYIVAVLDPSFGEVLTVATLEPDYSREFGRYLAFDDPELCSYVLSEEHLRKMPKLFKADSLLVHIAAGNREGQSDWSTLKIRLDKLRPSRLR
jgi:hypothetical protein